MIGLLAIVIVAMVILLIVDVGRYRRYWQQQIAAPVTNNSLTYVALGDSAAQSLGATSPRRGYVGLLAARLAEQTGRPVRVINLSRTGAKLSDVLTTQLPELAQYHADVVTIEIGANDMATYQPQTFTSQVDELMSRLPRGTIMSDLPYFGGRGQLPLLGHGQSERDVESANAILAKLANKHGLTLAPLHQATQARVGRAPWHYAVDYFHPNNAGYKIWADAFWLQVRDQVSKNP